MKLYIFFTQKFLRKEMNKAKLASTSGIHNGQYKQTSSVGVTNSNVNNSNHLTPSQQHTSPNTVSKHLQGTASQQLQQQFKVNFNSRKIPLLLNFPCGSAVRVFVSDSPITVIVAFKLNSNAT